VFKYPEQSSAAIQTRIMWLGGKDANNKNTYSRYIYIHGTNVESHLGTPASHGCVRMGNEDVIDLYDRVPVGTKVVVTWQRYAW